MTIASCPDLTPFERAALEVAIRILGQRELEVGRDGLVSDADGRIVSWEDLDVTGAYAFTGKARLTADEALAVRILNYLYAANLLHVAATNISMWQTADAFNRLAQMIGADAVERFKKNLKRQFGLLSRTVHVERVRQRAYALGAPRAHPAFR